MSSSGERQVRLHVSLTNGQLERRPDLKVLVLDEEIPYPPNAGKRIRTWNLLKRLAQRHTVCLLCYGSSSDPAAAQVQKAGINLCLVEPQTAIRGWRLYLRLLGNLFSPYPFSVAKHYSGRYQRRLDELLKQSWNLIHCEWTPYARFVSRLNCVPVVVATHNVESQIWSRRAQHAKNPIAKIFLWTQAWKMRRFERRALLVASSVTAVTADDRTTMRAWGVRNAALVPNGVDIEAYSVAPFTDAHDEILFLGSLDWHPNVDALTYFIEHIFNIIRSTRPSARLRVVGRKPSQALERKISGLAGVDFGGEVGDVRQELDRAAVVVVPLRIGGGSRLKILEALAAGKAVVCTSIGAEGLDVIPGTHLITADDPKEFAVRVLELLESNETRRRLGEEGRMLVEQRYGWNEIAARLERVWYEASQHDSGIPHEFQVTA